MTTRLLRLPDFPGNAVIVQQLTLWIGMLGGALAARSERLLGISSMELLMKSNYQDFGQYNEVDIAVAADAEATLPALIEACKKLITPERKRVFEQRAARYAEAAKRNREQDLQLAAWGWDASPISTARMSAEFEE